MPGSHNLFPRVNLRVSGGANSAVSAVRRISIPIGDDDVTDVLELYKEADGTIKIAYYGGSLLLRGATSNSMEVIPLPDDKRRDLGL